MTVTDDELVAEILRVMEASAEHHQELEETFSPLSAVELCA